MLFRYATFVAALAVCVSSADLSYTCEEGGYSVMPLFQLESVESMQECQKACGDIADCRAVVFNVEQKTCAVHGAEGVSSKPLVESNSLRCVKGDAAATIGASTEQEQPKQQQQQQQQEEEFMTGSFSCRAGGLSGEELLVVEHTDMAACVAHCDRIEGCAKLMHQADDVCTLYGKEAVVVSEGKSGATACSRQVAQGEESSSMMSFTCAEGSKFGGSLFVIGDTASIEECKRQCSVFSTVCKGINYGSDKSCELVDSVDTYASEGEKGLTSCVVDTKKDELPPKKDELPSKKDELPLSSPVFACSEEETLEGGELVSFGDVKQLESCQTYCLSFGSACTGFVYTSEDENCELKASTAKPVAKKANGVTCKLVENNKKPKDGGDDAEYTCTGKGSFVGGDLRIAARYSEKECRELCTDLKECFMYVMTTSEESGCVLKSSSAVEVTTGAAAALKQQGTVVSGTVCVKAEAKRQQEKQLGFGAIVEEEEEEARRRASLVDVLPFFSCTGRAVFDPKAVIRKVSEVLGASVCRERCHVTTSCRHSAYDPEGRECVLLTDKGVLTTSEEGKHELCSKKENTSVLGYRCTKGAYHGATVATVFGVGSTRECARACTASGRNCLISVYHPEDKRCVLKSVRAVPTQGVLEHSTACVSERVEAAREGFHCAESGAAALVEGTLSLLSDVTLEGCKEQCEQLSECAAVQYAAATKTCELKGFDSFAEGGKTGVAVCARHQTPLLSGAAVRSGEKSRYAQTLGGDAPEQAAYIKVKFGLHVEKLSKGVFEALGVAPTQDTTTLWVSLFVRVPVGIEPGLFAAASYHLLATELNKDDNIFMLKLNPTLLHLGLEPLKAGAGGRWSFVNDGFEWRPIANGILAIPFAFETFSGVELITEATRRWFSRSVGSELKVAASTVSMEEIFMCTDGLATEGCVSTWKGATPDTSGGPTGSHLPGAPSKRMDMLIDVPPGFTVYEWCLNVTKTLPCTGNMTHHLYKTFGLIRCGLCDAEDQAPMDGTLTSGGSGGRHLLQAAEGQLKEETTTAARSGSLLQSATGSRRGLARSCNVGWKPLHYGVMSDAFNVEGTAEVQGTLAQCVAACTTESGCFAFSRNRMLKDTESGSCWLKKAVIPVVGDQYSFNTLGTYVVTCPPEVEPCKWKYMDGYDQRTQSSKTTAFRAQSATECKDLCELVADCTGATFDRESATCYFIHDLVLAPTAAQQNPRFFSAVCYRVVPESPCDTSYCGVNPSVGCFPLRGGDHRCTCAEGFQCVENCDEPRKPHICDREETLETLLMEALSIALNVDVYGISVKEAEQLMRGSGDPSERDALTPEEQHVVTVASSKIDVETTHVISTTFSKTNLEDVLAEEQGKTKLALLAEGLAGSLGVETHEVMVRRVCKITDNGEMAACFDSEGADQAIPKRPTVKSTPEREYLTAASWCGAHPSGVANPKTLEAIEDLVQLSRGEMLETRTYWVGATCDENCNDADSWYWADAPAVKVDWASLSHGGKGASILNDLSGATCAVLQYDAEGLMWGLNVADCGAKGHYPVCVETGSGSGTDHADQCDASGACDLKVTFGVKLLHVRYVYFVSLPDGTTKKYHPSDLLPAGAKIVNRDGDLMGYVDSRGSTSVITWPAVDEPLNEALKAVMPGFTYPMEGLHALVTRHVASWMTAANLNAPFSRACHDLIIQKHVLCVNAICKLVDPMLITRTSCEGAPPCVNSVCNGHGYAKGFVGFCSCECDRGFAGAVCTECATGYKNYPQCDPTGTGSSLYEVFHLHVQSGASTVSANHDLLEQAFSATVGSKIEGYTLTYICPISVCSPSPCDSPVNTWSGERRAQCFRAGQDFAITDRGAVVLSGSRDFYPLVATSASVSEFATEYGPSALSDVSTQTKALLDQELNLNSGPFKEFFLTLVKSVYLSSEPYAGVTPVAAPFSPPVSVGGAGELVEGAGTDMGIIIVIVIAVVLFCCCFLMFGIWRHRKAQERKNREKTEDLMKYVNEDEDGEDIVTIFKGADEPMGIMWDDHTLMVGVCDDSAASRYNLDRFRNRRLARVNGMKVNTLADIRDAVEGQTCVTLEFEPKYSAIVVRVASKLEDFYEQEFISIFADRIAEVLNLMEFTEIDIDLQSVFERPERGELLLTMKLLGLTSDQVATIVAMCVTPGEPIRNGLPIAGAYLATAKFGEELPGVIEGGHPVWQHTPADHWLYSTPSGFWAIVQDKSLVGSDVTTGGYVLRSSEPHCGADPHVMTGWRTALREGEHICVAKEEPTAHEFIVGQRVVFPVDLQLEDGSVINKRSEALVMCEQEDLVQLCMLNEEYDIVTVSPDVVDSPDGPRIMVYENSQWMPAAIVKMRDNQVKVAFDCGLCPDMWIDKELEADKLKCMPREAFTMGDKVQLAAGAPQHLEEDGCLKFGELGVVVACGDAGQARPYLVEGPYDMTWYAGMHLTSFGQIEEPMASETDYSAPFGGATDESMGDMDAETLINSERKNQ